MIENSRYTTALKALKRFLGAVASTLPELALRSFPSRPAVSTIIPGRRSIANVETNSSGSDGKYLSEKLLKKLKKHEWVRNFYGAAYNDLAKVSNLCGIFLIDVVNPDAPAVNSPL